MDDQKLTLTTERGTLAAPDGAMVDAALADATANHCDFVILARRDECYVQTAGRVLEYREDGRHWRAVAIDPAQVRDVFHAFLAGDDEALARIDWTDVTDEVSARPRRGHGPGAWIFGVAMVSAVIGLVMLALAGWDGCA